MLYKYIPNIKSCRHLCYPIFLIREGKVEKILFTNEMLPTTVTLSSKMYCRHIPEIHLGIQ